MEIEEIIDGLRCETCSKERVFGEPPNSSPDNLLVYSDIIGVTRCFCKNHLSEGKYGAKLISEILNDLEADKSVTEEKQ